jgi:hypothetical protein
VYIAGFSFTSAVCAPNGIAHSAEKTSAHNPVKTLKNRMFILILLL